MADNRIDIIPETAAGPQTGVVFSALGHEEGCQFGSGGICICAHVVLTGKSRLTEPGGRAGEDATVAETSSPGSSARAEAIRPSTSSPVPTSQDAPHVPPLVCPHGIGASVCRHCTPDSPSQEGRAGELRACPEIDFPTVCLRQTDAWGMIRVSQWPEGLVLWVGGKIKWKSWQ